MTQHVSDCLRTMRLAIARRNKNDPDSSDSTLLQYINDFVTLTMSDDLKVFEQFGTLTFKIDQTTIDGVYTFNDVGASSQFTNISVEAFITLTNPPAHSISWNQLYIFQNPGNFYSYWGVNNEAVLIRGYPTQMLYYGDQMVFRTLPNTEYTIMIYGYKALPQFSSEGDPAIPFDYWMRYIAYGAAMNYARDYRFDGDKRQMLQADFQHEKKQLLTRTHNQIKMARSLPRF